MLNNKTEKGIIDSSELEDIKKLANEVKMIIAYKDNSTSILDKKAMELSLNVIGIKTESIVNDKAFVKKNENRNCKR